MTSQNGNPAIIVCVHENHAHCIKPQARAPEPPPIEVNSLSPRLYDEYLHVELPPCVVQAREYRQARGEDSSGMKLIRNPAKLMSAITLSSAILQELPLSLIDAAARSWRRWLKIARYPLHEDFCLHSSPLP